MSSSSDSPPLNTYATPWGPPLTATLLASIIYGITVLQTFSYYTTYQKDRISWKIYVGLIFIIDTVALGLYMYCLQYYLVLSWGLPDKEAVDVITFPIEYIFSAVLTFLVQAFYINTIRALRANIIVVLGLLALSFTALATGLVLPVVQIQLHLIPAIVVAPLNHVAFNIARGTALACDVCIVIVLCWLLGLRRTGIQRANSMINTLMVFAVQRGVLQAVIQAGEVMSYAIRPAGIYFLPFHVIISRIYCTSILATLNTRGYVARRGVVPEESDARNSVAYDDEPQLVQSETGGNRAVFSSYFDPPFLSQEEREDPRFTAVFEARNSHQTVDGEKTNSIGGLNLENSR